MPASSVQIANLALTKLGEPNPLLALTDDTNAGRVMNRIYTHVRDAELRRHNWKFAIKRTQLTALTAAPDWGYERQFALPPDLLRIVQVNDIFLRSGYKHQMPWSIEAGPDGAKHILTNLIAPLKIRYTYSVENAGLFDPLFVEAFACKLGWESCEQITQSSTKKAELKEQYQMALLEAARCDSLENPPDELPWGTWLDSREGPGGSLAGDDWTAYPAAYRVT